MPKHMVYRIRALGPTLAASITLFVAGCAEDSFGAGFEGASEEGGFDDDAGLDELADKAISGPSKVKNEGAGTCWRRSTSQKVGNGYEVYQTSCSDTAAEVLWRADCSAGICRYVTGGSTTYCLKASSSIKASGGSYSVYAASCSSDSDQKWSVRDLGGGRLQLKNVETGRCAYSSEAEKTADGRLQVVQRDCDTSSKYQFTLVTTGAPPQEPPTPPPTDSGSSNTLMVQDGSWKYVYCSGSAVKVSSSSSNKQRWVKRGARNIYNESVKKYLYCPELDGGYAPTECECSDRVENYHQKTSATTGSAPATISLNRDIYISPNNNMNACFKVIRGDRVHSPCAIEPWRNQTCRKDNGDSFSSSEHAAPCNKFRLND